MAQGSLRDAADLPGPAEDDGGQARRALARCLSGRVPAASLVSGSRGKLKFQSPSVTCSAQDSELSLLLQLLGHQLRV
eukprot:5644861-Pyramimonas_sp.AAC.1